MRFLVHDFTCTVKIAGARVVTGVYVRYQKKCLQNLISIYYESSKLKFLYKITLLTSPNNFKMTKSVGGALCCLEGGGSVDSYKYSYMYICQSF